MVPPGVVRWVIGYQEKPGGEVFIVEHIFQSKKFAKDYAKFWVVSVYPRVFISKLEGNLVDSEEVRR